MKPLAITRRDALKIAGAGALAASAPNLAWAGLTPGDATLYPSANPHPWPVLQGPTDDRSASFMLLLPNAYRFSVRVTNASGHRLPTRVAAERPMPELGLATFEVVASGLAPGRDYVLWLLNADGAYFDRRVFRALDVAASGGRFAALSCMNDFYRRESVTMWEALQRERCDFVIFHGDTCYADQRMVEDGPAGIARRYAETRMALAWFRFERLTPTFAVWDDHDFGTNNGDRTFEYADFTRGLFRSFFGAADNRAWRKGPGVASRLEAFGQRFYLLDDRSFRDPRGAPDGRHWGPEQLAWLFGDIGQGRTPSWVISGTQFFGENPLRESVEADQPADLARLTGGLSQIRAPVALISGDVHFSEIREVDPRWLGYPTYEFTSSSMHSLPNPGIIHQGNVAAERRHNFMVFDIDPSGGFGIRCRSVMEHNRVAFDESFAISR